MMNNFLSLSASMCLINVQPVPIKTMVMNKTAPFSLSNSKQSQLKLYPSQCVVHTIQ